MNMIESPYKEAFLARKGKIERIPTISEVGVYSIYMTNGGSEEIVNKTGGYLMRTKKGDSREGGVATGYAVVDIPYLV